MARMNADFRRKSYKKRNAIELMFWGLKDFRRGVPKAMLTLVGVVITLAYYHRLSALSRRTILKT